jgi:hypothetical protein
MKKYMELLMVWTMVLLGAAFFMSSEASAIIVGTPPAATVGTTFIGPVLPSGVPLGFAPSPSIGVPPGLAKQPFGLPPGLVRQPIFNPFLFRPVFNPFFNPLVDADGLGIGVGLGVNPGLVD